MNKIEKYFKDESIGYDEKMACADQLSIGKTFEEAVAHGKEKISRLLNQNVMGAYGNLWFRNLHLNKGDRVAQHTHEHPHVTLIGHGKVQAEIEGHEPIIASGGDAVLVPANLKHSFVGLEDGTEAFCTYALRTDDGEVVDWEDALTMFRPRSLQDPDIPKHRLQG